MSYSNFGIEDFAKDPYFQAWVLQDDPAINSFWELWMELYPEKEEMVSAAIEILLGKCIEKTAPVPEKQTNKAWKQLHKTIEPGIISFQDASSAGINKKKTIHWKPVAAALTGLLLVALGFWFYPDSNSAVTYTSRNSQVLPVSLPDGSQVLLNANSSLSFKNDWDDKQEREVWLKGEAFFSVTKKPALGGPTFTVHATNVKVQVLGTQFNVADRSAKTQVILNSGKIKLLVPESGKPKALTMVAGDYVALVKKDKRLIETRVNPEAFSGWRSGKLKFNNTPLTEIMGQIEQTYGTKVSLTDSDLLNSTFTGTFPNDNLPLLLKTLEKAFQVQVSQQGQTLTFARASNS